jgi:CHAT domain-containing protein
MKNIRRSETICILMLLAILAFCGSVTAIGQTPTQTQIATSKSQTSPQTSPSPEIKDPEVKAFVEKVKLVQSLFSKSTQFMKSGTDESKAEAEAKLLECIELSRNLYEKLNDKNFGKNIIQTGYSKADYQTLLKVFQSNAEVGLGNLGEVSRDWQKSVRYKKLSLASLQEIFASTEMRTCKIFNQFADSLKRQELSTLEAITTTLSGNLNNPAEALEYANRALTIARQRQGEDEKLAETARTSEARILQRIGLIYLQMDSRPKTIEYYKQSLSVYQSLPDQKHNVARLLFGIGSEYFSELDYKKALEYLNEALKIAEEIDNQDQQVSILGHFAIIYESLGNESKALEFWQRQLAVLLSPDYMKSLKRNRAGGHKASAVSTDFPDIAALAAKNDEFFRLLSIAITYRKLKDYAQSLSYYEQALPVARSMKSLSPEQLVLSLIGNMHVEKQDWQKALDYYRQSLKISRELPQKSLAASDLQNISYIYFELGRWQDAWQTATEALLMYQTSDVGKENVDTGYASTLSVMARTQHARGNRRLATFFGKLAVNAIQKERQQLKALTSEDQSGYLKQNEKPYRRLADWLIAEGRVAEVEQVLPIIKEDEYFDYLRRDPKVAEELFDRLSLTDDERDGLKRFEKLTRQIAALSKEYDELKQESMNFGAGKFPKQADLKELDEKLAEERAAFVKFLGELDAQFRSSTTNPKDLGATASSTTRQLLNHLNQPRTVIISTIAGEDHLNLIVTTVKDSHVHTVDIKAAYLNKLVLKFRAAVKNPNIDPRATGKELYGVLFPSDLQKELANVKADTIVWSLDGTLRYAPLSALWDGKQYLAEKYANSVITLASRNKLKQSSSGRTNWTALGVGVSEGGAIKGVDGTSLKFVSLPAVREELCNIVNDPHKEKFCARLRNGKSGIFNGRNLADDEFTLESFKRNLGRYSIVHIASHFNLNVGSETDSFLLLGGKNEEERKLTMAAMRKELRTKFTGVELLTLSACNTAMSSGDKANGAEIESFGVLAQNQGAKSVLATLWPVADPSTRDLMTAFYRNLAINWRIGKAVALRKAQLTLLQGKYKEGETPLWRRGLKFSGGTGNRAPQFNRDVKARYAHPYYWSPFVLMGDWR